MSKQVIDPRIARRSDRRREAVINPHPDPITGETGSHPIATGIGAGIVGTIGMLVGSVTGPVGAIAGAAIGSILGGLVGKSAAEATHPTIEDYDVQVIEPRDVPRGSVASHRRIEPVSVQAVYASGATPPTVEQSIIHAALRGRNSLVANEDQYWQQHYTAQPYYQSGLTYRDYQPAYRLGYEGYTRYHGTGMSYDEVEPELQQQYEQERRLSWLGWEQARPAVRAGWHRLEQAFRGR
ncbi:hypothetical protein [Leptolyngbya sp. GB1-A1]|uniref:hypothetical protein n=1 Tax=unclassified Leptolyngbya TaxID=2650499 RepID=UPI0019CAA21A|nr:hypothetical protein [Cyanobacteria bacterium FACHB-502]